MKPNAVSSGLSRWLLGPGREPDPRFTLANERTFLAWIRTALALLASGIAVEAFTLEVFGAAIKHQLVLGLLSLSLLLSLGAFWRWLRVERALRREEALPVSLLTPLLSLGCTLLVTGVLAALWGRG
nr:hypothetical protein FFPRI1PSEUD_41250 [Pseudomonas sp. FFPRI_1]